MHEFTFFSILKNVNRGIIFSTEAAMKTWGDVRTLNTYVLKITREDRLPLQTYSGKFDSIARKAVVYNNLNFSGELLDGHWLGDTGEAELRALKEQIRGDLKQYPRALEWFNNKYPPADVTRPSREICKVITARCSPDPGSRYIKTWLGGPFNN